MPLVYYFAVRRIYLTVNTPKMSISASTVFIVTSNICALCTGYMNKNCAFYDLSFSSLFISKFCVILSKHFHSTEKKLFYSSAPRHTN